MLQCDAFPVAIIFLR